MTGLIGGPLSAADYAALEARWIDRVTADLGILRRVDTAQGSQMLGRNGSGRYDGIAIPYIWPGENRVREHRVRRDHPEFEGGKPKGKYMAPPGRGNMLYFAPATEAAWLTDTRLPIVITEGEFKVLALYRAAWHGFQDTAERPLFLPVGLAGVWNWHGTIGKFVDHSGTRVDEKGPIADLSRINWNGRTVTIIFDRDCDSKESIKWARFKFTRELQDRGALLKWFKFPDLAPEAKGIDDLLAAIGPDQVLAAINQAAPQVDRRRSSGESVDGQDAKFLDFPLTDVGNAERMVQQYGDILRYCHPWGKWLVNTGPRWELDATSEVTRRAVATTRKMFTMGVRLSDADKRDKVLKFARDTEKHARITAMIALAAAQEGIPVQPNDLDADPWLLNVLNGTLDLRTGKLSPHRPEDMITMLAPVVYDATADCPTWLMFLDRITGGNEDLIQYKRRAIGYALTGLATDKRSLFIYYGVGNNGKTTELEVLRDMLGDYAGQVRIDSLLEHRLRDGSAPSPDIADLRGKRFVVSSEPPVGQQLAEAKVKYLTSMGTISARHLHKENFEFKQTWKFFMDCNHKPVIRGSDNAIWNRIGLVPFDVVIPDDEIDRDLPAKLRSELSGILAWAVRGCLAWQNEGVGLAECVRFATSEYRSEMDSIGRFITASCVIGEVYTARGNQLYSAYKNWCEKEGENAVSLTAFGEVYTAKGFRKERDKKGLKYIGIGLAEDRCRPV